MAKAFKLFLRWLEVEKGYSSHTVDGYGHDLQEFITGIGEDLDVTAIEALHIRRFVVALYGHNSAATVGRKLSALRTFSNFSLEKSL